MQTETKHASQLQKDTITGGVYYLKGNDPYWLTQAESFFRSMLPEDSLSLRVLETVSDVTEILSAFDTFCLGDEHTIVIVKDDSFTMNDREHTALISLLQSELTTDFLVFCNSPFLTNAEIKLCNVIDCSALDKFACSTYAEKLFPNGIEKKALQLLIELCGYNMAKIKSEAQKLNAYCDNTLVSYDDVEMLVVEDTESTVFLFSNCIVEGQLQKAERHLDKLIKRGEKPAMLLSILSNQFRRMLYCSITTLDNKQMAELLGIKEFAVEKTRKIKGYTQAKLRSCVAVLSECEFKFKSGIMSDETAFSIAVSKLLCKEAV